MVRMLPVDGPDAVQGGLGRAPVEGGAAAIAHDRQGLRQQLQCALASQHTYVKWFA